MRENLRHIARELPAHFPFTLFATSLGLVLAAILTYVNLIVQAPQEQIVAASRMLFHAFHPVHLLFSAIATTAMFCRHEQRYFKAIVVGLVGSLGICGLSDIFLPYLCGLLLRVEHMHFHWCLVQHPQMVLPFAVMGVFGGIVAAKQVHGSTIYSHSAHVFVSSLATLFYLISYGVGDWMGEHRLPYVFIILVLCVMLPCCFSDIVFPLFALDEGCIHCHPSTDETPHPHESS